MRQSLRRFLSFNGYEVIEADDGEAALTSIKQDTPDLAILDVVMPKMDGLEVCRTLRSSGNTIPVVLLSARDRVADRVAGLDSGADDYLPKPFALEELLARVRSVMRRSHAGRPDQDAVDEELVFEDLHLNPETRDVRRGRRSFKLTRTEFALLRLFMRNPRRVLERSTILDEVWGADFPSSGNALEVYIGYLRRKTEEEGEDRLIHTVRGVGYVLRETDL